MQVPRTGTPGVLDSCDDELPSGILVGSCLFNMESKVPVRVLNVRDKRVTLLIYFDDVIITGKTFKEHLNNLGEVLSRLREFGVKLKPTKCSLFRENGFVFRPRCRQGWSTCQPFTSSGCGEMA